jgi:hypothetical protein
MIYLSPTDRDALQRAMDEARRDPMRAEQLAGIEADHGLLEAQRTAAYLCQTNNLKLRPWESPPMFGDAHPGHDGHAGGAELLHRLRRYELSRYEPHPLRALAKVEAPSEQTNKEAPLP